MRDKMNSISIWRYTSPKITKNKLDDMYIHRKTHKQLHVACLYNLHSYRCGLLGWMVSFLCELLPSTYMVSSIISRLKWTSDRDLIATSISYINRLFPIFNYGVWNRRERFLKYNALSSIFKHGGELDTSLSGMFDICSPFFDNGIAIFSNVECSKRDFVPFIDKKNRGILWNYFDEFEVLIMTISTDGNIKDQAVELEQLQAVYEKVSSDVYCKHTYIIGNFKNEVVSFKNFSITSINHFTYLLSTDDYIPNVDGNCIKFNTPLLSPVYSPRPVTVTVAPPPAIIEEEQKEEVEEKKPQEQQQDPQKPEPEIQQPNILSSIINNYFGYRTPSPTITPPITVTPASSPSSTSSDNDWAKV